MEQKKISHQSYVDLTLENLSRDILLSKHKSCKLQEWNRR